MCRKNVDNKTPSTKSSSTTTTTVMLNQFDFDQRRREHLFTLPLFCQKYITKTFLRHQDERNMGIFLVGFNVATTSLPLAVSLYCAERYHWLSNTTFAMLGLLYSLGHCKIYARSFLLSLHFLSHCSIFNAHYRFLDQLWTQVLCILFGIPPGLYRPHHIGMHHAMDNMYPHDASSTMAYHRYSKWNHFKYMLRFVTMGGVELPYRLMQMKKYSLAVQAMMGCTTFWTLMVVGWMYSPKATFFVLTLPWLVCSFGLMQGNFKEHIFVDPCDPHNNYKSAFTCINTPHNALTFNSGYHLEHHEEPGLPWYRLPELFLKNLDKHAANDSFVFSGISVMQVGTLVLYGQFDTLADHYLNVGQPKRTRQELIQEFKRRLTRIHHSE